MASPGATDAPSADEKTKFGFHKKVKLRILNEGYEPMWVKDLGDGQDYLLEHGQSWDVTSWSFWSGHADAMADITYRSDGTVINVWGYNPEMGWPSVGFGDSSTGNWDRYGVGQKIEKTAQGKKFTVTRTADADTKNFTIGIH